MTFIKHLVRILKLVVTFFGISIPTNNTASNNEDQYIHIVIVPRSNYVTRYLRQI